MSPSTARIACSPRIGVCVGFDWAMNQSGTEYCLYADRQFNGIPLRGDLSGFIRELIAMIREQRVNVTAIRVLTQRVGITYEAPADEQQIVELAEAALQQAGLNWKDTSVRAMARH